MIGLIPCAGRATRLGGLPKFLLPCGTNLSSPSTRGGALCLMSRLIIDMRKYCVRIVVPSSPTNDELIKTYVLPQLPRNVRDHVDVLDIGITDTMTETVLRARDWIRSLTPDVSPLVLFAMPDTYLTGGIQIDRVPVQTIENRYPTALLWKIRQDQCGKVGQCDIDQNGTIVCIADKAEGCPFGHLWGALIWNEGFWDLLDPSMPHVGYALQCGVPSIEQDGYYYDCGTFAEYSRMIRSEILT
jgi:hypothetical protein